MLSFSTIFTCSLLLSILHLTSAQDAQRCYYPDGTDRNALKTNNKYITCNSTVPGASHSMCCDTTFAGGSTCMPNGLCHYNSMNSIFREGCTDPSWKDPGCLNLYTTGKDANGYDRHANTLMLVLCDIKTADAEFCEAVGSDACCKNNQGFVIRDGVAMAANATIATTPSTTTTTVSSQSPISTVATTAMSTSTASASPPNSNSDANTNTQTGIIVAGVLGGLVLGMLFGLAVFLVIRRKRNSVVAGDHKAQPEQDASRAKASYLEKSSTRSSATIAEMVAWQGNEMSAGTPYFEMEHQQRRLELANSPAEMAQHEYVR